MNRTAFTNDPRSSTPDGWDDIDDIDDDPFAQWVDLITKYGQQLVLEPCERTGLAIQPVALEQDKDIHGRLSPSLRFGWTPTVPAATSRVFALVADNNWNVSVAFDVEIPPHPHTGYVTLKCTDLGDMPEWVFTEMEEELNVVFCVLQPGYFDITERIDFLNYLSDYEFDIDDLVALFNACWMQNGADITLYVMAHDEAVEIAKACGWR